MTDKFISTEITVARDDKTGQPLSFEWEGRTYVIREVIAEWQDYGFSSGAPQKKTWRMRRHRNYYRVETSDGDVFELYHDRGIKMDGAKWILLSQIC
ncbi:MAG: DUF6504 family protein [Candidatus Zixiibacteriota bacterium]